jgi:hypothetical protein
LKRHQFGGTAGGPIVPNRLFFFAGIQRTTLRSDPRSTRAVIPTPAMLSGDWTTYASAACNSGNPLNLPAPFVNNRINPAQFSPAAMKLVNNQNPKPFPRNADDACGNITYSGAADRSNDDMYVGRIDYQMSGSHSVFGRFMIEDYGQINPDKFNTIYLQQSGSSARGTSPPAPASSSKRAAPPPMQTADRSNCMAAASAPARKGWLRRSPNNSAPPPLASTQKEPTHDDTSPLPAENRRRVGRVLALHAAGVCTDAGLSAGSAGPDGGRADAAIYRRVGAHERPVRCSAGGRP